MSISMIVVIHDCGDREYTERLERCLLSMITYQSKPPSEAIVVDSSDTKEREDVATSVGARYIVAPIAEFNICKLFNIGIKAAKGEYIGATDVDIIFSPGFFESAMVHIRKKRKKVFLIARDVRYLQEGEARHPSPFYPSMASGHSHTEGAIGIQLAHRDWWAKVGGYDEAMAGTLHGIDTDMYYRARADGLRICRVSDTILHQWHPISRFKNKLVREE